MAGEWTEYPLGEIVDVYDGPHATPNKSAMGPVFLGISNLVGGRLDLANTERLSDKDFERWTRRVTPMAGDVVFSYETRLGEAAMIPPGLRCCLGRRMGLLRNKDRRVDMRFLLYAYLGPEFQETLRSRTIHGSTVDRIPLIEMPQFLIRVPESIDEQRAIAQILGTLDDKIELNRRMNETLEAMGRAFFKSWFVDFDPVRTKSSANAPSSQPRIAELFPKSFQESEIGAIPQGWTEKAVYDTATFVNGVAFRSVHFSPDGSGLPIVKIAELKDGIKDLTKFTTDALPTKYRIQDGEILFSWSGSPDTSIDTFIWAGGDAWLNQHIFKVVFNRPEDKHFVYYLLKYLKPIFVEIARNKQTTGLGHVTAQDMKRLKFAFPPDPVLKAFHEVVDPIFRRSFEALIETRTLTALRDALLPKLMSGELCVFSDG
jgi:type I restriction enzyme S subunit